MMSYDELVQLLRRSDGTRMLSVYLPGPSHDPALRAESQTLLEAGLSRIRHTLTDSPRADREAFLAASEHVVHALQRSDRPRSQAGIAVFAAANGVRHVAGLLESPPTVIEWRDGIVVSPYLAALPRARQAVVAVIDSRRAQLYERRDGQLTDVDAVEAEIRTDEPLHMGDDARVPWHHGVHGATGTDETQRRELAAFERMLHPVVQRLMGLANTEAFVVIGGMPESAQRLLNELPKSYANRSVLVNGLTTQSTASDILKTVEAAVADLMRHQARALVRLVLDRGRAGDRASLGLFRTRLALEERAASELLMSRRFLERRFDRAERLARLAMDGGAHVEILNAEAGAKLDAESEGVAAELRYALPFSSFVAAGLQGSPNS